MKTPYKALLLSLIIVTITQPMGGMFGRFSQRLSQQYTNLSAKLSNFSSKKITTGTSLGLGSGLFAWFKGNQEKEREKALYTGHMNNGRTHIRKYIELKTGPGKKYNNEIDAKNAGLNVGLFWSDESDCSKYNNLNDRKQCQETRERAFNELRNEIEKEKQSTGITTRKRIFHDQLAIEREEAKVNFDSARRRDSDENYLYHGMKLAALNKMARYSVGQDPNEDDVEEMKLGISSSLDVDTNCNTDICNRVREQVRNELTELIKKEQKRAEITNEERANLRKERAARFSQWINDSKESKN